MRSGTNAADDADDAVAAGEEIRRRRRGIRTATTRMDPRSTDAPEHTSAGFTLCDPSFGSTYSRHPFSLGSMYIFTPRTSARPTNVAGALGASSDADVKPSPLTMTRTRSLSSRARSARAIAYTYAALKTPKAPNAARPRAESLAMTAVDAARARLSEPNLRCAMAARDWTRRREISSSARAAQCRNFPDIL